MESHDLSDALWNRYRAWADGILASRADRMDPGERRSLLYLRVVRYIARWVDRVEGEPDLQKRARMIGRLLNGPLADPSAIDLDPRGWCGVGRDASVPDRPGGAGGLRDRMVGDCRYPPAGSFGPGPGWDDNFL